MGLINLRTNLKDLKFGHDEPSNGNSGQPFVQTRIPATDEPLQTGISNAGPVLASVGAGAAIGAIGGSILGNTGAGVVIGAAAGLGIGIIGTNATTSGFRLPSAGTGGPDFLVRGGTLLPNIIANDEIRLSKYFASTEGILFAVKQNLLSRTGTRAQGTTGFLNERLYTPISTLLGAVGTPFGLHVNKQGLNPLLGLGDSYTPDRYFAALAEQTQEINNNPGSDAITHNKLYGLYAVKLLGDSLVPFYKRNGITSQTSTNILSYQGGPGSFLGIGKTNIGYATDNVGAPLSIANTPSYKIEDTGYNTLDYTGIDEISKNTNGGIGNFRSPTSVDFRTKLRIATKTLYQIAPSYNPGDGKTIEQRVNLGDPGNSNNKNIISYTQGYTPGANGAASPNSFDKINSSKIYRTTLDEPNKGDSSLTDLVQFRIGVIDNNSPSYMSYLNFRAFLNQITDTFTSNWDATKYIGRGENFYTYSGFDRKYSLSWTVAAQSKAELIPMYRKLNYLASLCAPDYSDAGYMRGNIVRLTVGGYFYEQPGILRGFSYEMNDDNSSWEIGINDEGGTDGSVRELPHLIKVSSFEFIPIHEFVPKKQYIEFNPNTDIAASYGSERYIALENKTGDLYTSERINYNTTPIKPISAPLLETSFNQQLQTLPPSPPPQIVPTTNPPPPQPNTQYKVTPTTTGGTGGGRPFQGFGGGMSGGGGAGGSF